MDLFYKKVEVDCKQQLVYVGRSFDSLIKKQYINDCNKIITDRITLNGDERVYFTVNSSFPKSVLKGTKFKIVKNKSESDLIVCDKNIRVKEVSLPYIYDDYSKTYHVINIVNKKKTYYEDINSVLLDKIIKACCIRSESLNFKESPFIIPNNNTSKDFIYSINCGEKVVSQECFWDSINNNKRLLCDRSLKTINEMLQSDYSNKYLALEVLSNYNIKLNLKELQNIYNKYNFGSIHRRMKVSNKSKFFIRYLYNLC